LSDELLFIGKTDEEISLVCATALVPPDACCREDGWRTFRIQGTLDFSLIGILARISSLLAEQAIGIFVISTYNTDYVLLKEENLAKAKEVLSRADYHFV
jgi:hypothetical protein